MLHFRIFGVPVTIQPWFWLMSAVFSIGAVPGGVAGLNNPESLLLLALCMLGIFVSILVHELGHALTGLGQGAKHSEIVLWGMGGYAMFPGHRGFTRQQERWMVLAGPLWQFVFGLGLLAAIVAWNDAWNLLSTLLPDILATGEIPLLSAGPYYAVGFSMSLAAFGRDFPLVAQALGALIGMSLYWPVLNLIPVLPLDGGRLMANAMGPWDLRKPRLWSAIVGAVVGVVLIVSGSNYFGIFLLFLALQNWQELQRGY